MTAPRRVYLEWRELPGLYAGALRGEPVALRRILGARKGGRIGLALGLATLLAAAPLDALGWLVGLHVALGLAVAAVTRAATGLGPRQALRLSLWPAAPLLLLALPFRPLATAAPAFVAVAVGQLLLWRGLRRGLD